jgi:excinuclease ABC subunit B
MQYNRSELEWKRGQFRVRGDSLDIWPAYEKFAVHVELFGDEIDRIELVNPTSGEVLADENQFFLFPAVHYVMPEEQLQTALAMIREELDARVLQFRSEGKLLEAQRLISRTKYDLELLAETGTCPGIENYSRFMDGRMPGERPYTLLDYFDFAPPAQGNAAFGQHAARNEDNTREESVGTAASAEALAQRGTLGMRTPGLESPARERILRPNYRDWLLIIDESHVTMPQIRAMFNGDKARKTVLVDHGFRLPSAMDNRPLRFEEFEAIVPQLMFVSATPAAYELEKTGGVIAEQVIRPTGLLDPEIEIKPTKGQVPDLLEQCQLRISRGERVLVTALTKRLCEDLANYLNEKGLKVRYLHSDIETLDRVEILVDLRMGNFDVLVGVNLLREGLDLPEVSLVAILDADKEGFLRSPTSLIQLMGRAARNINGRVIMYADKMTPAMQHAIDETERRRTKQRAYNAANNITPLTIQKAIRRGLAHDLQARKTAREATKTNEPEFEIGEMIRMLDEEMLQAANSLEFERAAHLRDQVNKLKQRQSASKGESPAKIRRSDVEQTGKGKSRRGGKTDPPGAPGTKAGKKKGRRG